MPNPDYIEELCEFEANGKRLIGILTSPLQADARIDSCVLVLIPYGLNPRFGPHRFHVRIARTICKQGCRVFRFDSIGCGDSEGDITQYAGRHRDDVFWHLVADKVFIDDVIAAVNYVKGRLQPQGIILAGICGGAVRAILAGADEESVKGVIAAGFPSTIDDSSLDSIDKMNPKVASSYFFTYMHRLFSPEAWGRLLCLRCDWKRIGKTFSTLLMSKLRFVRGLFSTSQQEPRNHTSINGRNINWTLIHSLRKCVDLSKPLLTIYGGGDRYLGDFEDLIESRHLANTSLPNDHVYEKFVVQNSNHEFSFSEWQEAVIKKIGDWLEERFTTRSI